MDQKIHVRQGVDCFIPYLYPVLNRSRYLALLFLTLAVCTTLTGILSYVLLLRQQQQARLPQSNSVLYCFTEAAWQQVGRENTHECTLSGHLFDIEQTWTLGHLRYVKGHFDQREETILKQLAQQKNGAQQLMLFGFCFLEEIRAYQLSMHAPEDRITYCIPDERIPVHVHEADSPPPKATCCLA